MGNLNKIISCLGLLSILVSNIPEAKAIAVEDEICNNLYKIPDKILAMPAGGAGRFGSYSTYIEVSETDYCTSRSGSVQTGPAVDGGPLFAYFINLDAITLSCDDGTSYSLTKGNGIARFSDTYPIEIYAQFEESSQVHYCALRFNADGTLNNTASNCSDNVGTTTLPIAATASCSLQATQSRLAVPTTFEGHYAVSTDEGQTVAYDCSDYRTITTDVNGFNTIANDCSLFEDYGFNMESFNAGVIVGGDASSWTFYDGVNLDDLANKIKIMHQAGYPIMLSIDVLYVAAYDGSNPEVVADGVDFPQAMIDNAAFQTELTNKIYAIADMAESLHVEILSPLSETDRIFSQSTTADAASIYLQNIRPTLQTHFTGALMWIAMGYESTNTSRYNFDGFSYAGVNISPKPDNNPTEFLIDLQSNLSNLQSLGTHFNIPYMITNAGIWGGALTSTRYDWDANPGRVVNAFRTMYTQSEAYGTSGIIFWEGAAGEVVFGDYLNLSRFIANKFGGDASVFW